MESETKTFEPSGEVFEHRLPEMDSEYENFKARLIPEWQVITDKLMQTARGRTIMSDSRFCDYLRTSSLEIESIDEVISDLTTTPNQFRAVEHRNMYYRLPSLIDMTNRPHILSFIADGLKQEVDELDDYETKMVRRRRLASVRKN